MQPLFSTERRELRVSSLNCGLEKELKGGRRHEGGEGGKEGGTREDRRVRSEGTCMAVTQF